MYTWSYGRIDIKEDGGETLVTTCRGRHTPLTAGYTGLEVPQPQIKVTRIFHIPASLQNKVVLGYELHIYLKGEAKVYLVTSIKAFQGHTEIVGLLQGAVAAGVGETGESGIISRWSFGDSGDLGFDSEGANPLTEVNTPNWSSDSHPNADPQDGSCDFERSSSERLEITDGSQSGLDLSGDHTIVCRVKLESIPSATTVIAKSEGGGGSPTGRAYELWIDSGGIIRYGLSADGANATTAIGGTALSTGTWYSIAVVYDKDGAGEIIIYLDGSEDSNGSNNPKSFSSTLHNSSEKFVIGAQSDGQNHMDGKIDDVRIYNEAKSASEISDWHSNGST